MALAQDANAPVRLYSLSRRLHENRAQYYDVLNAAPGGALDVTDWVVWFVTQFEAACEQSAAIVRAVVDKAHFWRRACNHRAGARDALRSGFALSGDSIVVNRSTRLEGGTNAFEFEEWARSEINAPGAIAIMPG